jgi:Uma2 family endonuclease
MRPTETAAAFEQEFPYGWRYVKRTLPEGGETLEQIPLTLEDVLHPQEGDVIPENTDHDADCFYLASVFRSRPLAPPFALVTHDLLVNWGVPGIRNHSPDLAVFVGLSSDPRPTGLLELPDLGGRCELVVEVVSPNTRDNDVVAKMAHYHQVGIPLYVIIDQEKEGGPRTLRAYKRKPDRYVEIESDDRDRIDVPLLGLILGMRDNHVVCYDLRTDQELGDYTRIVRDLEEASRRLEEADRRSEQQQQAYEDQVEARQQAERRAADAQKEADRQREEADRQREEADRQRRAREEAEKQQSLLQQEADKQRLAREEAAQEAARQIRELQDLLHRLQAGGSEPTGPAT